MTLPLLTFFIVTASTATLTFGDTVGNISSKIKGVQIWSLRDPGVVGIVEGNEFKSHCSEEKKSHVFLTGFDGPVDCTTMPKGNLDFPIRLKFNKKNRPTYAVASLKKLPEMLNPPEATDKELALLNQLIEKKRGELQKSDQENYLANWGGATEGGTVDIYKKIVASTKTSPLYLKQRASKIKTQNGDLFIIPLGPSINPMGWDLEIGIFKIKGADKTFVGQITGCPAEFRDFNGDSVADILTETCSNDESVTYLAYSLSPTVQVIMSQ